MTLPLLALIAIAAGLAAAAAVFLLLRLRPGVPPGTRLTAPCLAFVLAALLAGGLLYGLGGSGGPQPGAATSSDPADPSYRVLEAIKRHHPDSAAEIEAIRGETDPVAAQHRSSELAQRYLPRHMPTTSDVAVLRFTGEMTKLFEKLAQQDPETCKALTTSGRVSASFDAQNMRPALDAMTDIIEESVSAPQPPPEPQRAQELLGGVIQRVYAQPNADLAPPQLLAQPAALPAAQFCNTMIAFYREILKLPPADASVVLRTLMRSGDNR